jgi:predicted DNA-binding transcriptional regulator AlpA
METDQQSLLMTAAETARELRVGRATLWAWARDGHGPQPVDVSRPGARRRTVRYRRADVLAFIGASHE